MKKIVFVICFLFSAIIGIAQSVSYTYKPLAAEGCQVRYTPSWQEGKPYLIVSVKSDRMKFVANPMILLKTVEDEIIKLEGVPLDVSSSSYGMIYSGIIFPIEEFNATAQFPITDEQINLLDKGIIKVRISMVPMNHERTFKKDKIGKKLFKAFQKSKKIDDNF